MLQHKLPHANLDVNTPGSFSHETSWACSRLCCATVNTLVCFSAAVRFVKKDQRSQEVCYFCL